MSSLEWYFILTATVWDVEVEMQHILFMFYILFFATGFMGTAALAVLRFRIQSRLLGPLLLFQIVFLAALGMTLIYFYLQNVSAELGLISIVVMNIVMVLNAALYGIVLAVVRRLSLLPISTTQFSSILFRAALITASLSILKIAANILFVDLSAAGSPLAATISEASAWSLGGYILNTFSMLFFGIAAVRFKPTSGEPKIIGSLLRGYGICILIFTPAGIAEYIIETLEMPGLPFLSLDHFFYLAWNLVSMSIAVRLFRPLKGGNYAEDPVPEERARVLRLSSREREAAVLISRGMSNKEIAAELGISPATVRTHIYNLYQKAGARSRVELLNKLKV